MRKGDLYLVDLGVEQIGSEQKGRRPAVIIQNNVGNVFSPTTIIALVTTKDKTTPLGKRYPMHVELKKTDTTKNALENDSTVLCEQIYTIDKSRLSDYLGSIQNHSVIEKINKSLTISLDL